MTGGLVAGWWGFAVGDVTIGDSSLNLSTQVAILDRCAFLQYQVGDTPDIRPTVEPILCWSPPPSTTQFTLQFLDRSMTLPTINSGTPASTYFRSSTSGRRLILPANTCSAQVNLAFVLNGTAFNISNFNYDGARNGTLCEGVVTDGGSESDDPRWVIGAPFSRPERPSSLLTF